ncbi:MAG: hypothetical protein IGR92_01945 [Leptolyngbyaceae cyanobacterium T60_A2020_046]|nr:hypothetical protein [Leptolyngbyaceae cyanobacterium T60_A2020_046]
MGNPKTAIAPVVLPLTNAMLLYIHLFKRSKHQETLPPTSPSAAVSPHHQRLVHPRREIQRIQQQIREVHLLERRRIP